MAPQLTIQTRVRSPIQPVADGPYVEAAEPNPGGVPPGAGDDVT